MILYWFWFLFPVGLFVILTAIEIDRAQRNNVEPRFAIAFFFFTGFPAFIPGWVVLYSQVFAVVQSIVIPADQVGTVIADFTMAAVGIAIFILHFLVAFVLLPTLIVTVLRKIKPLDVVAEKHHEKQS